MKLMLNGVARELPADVDAAMPLLWVLRDVLDLTGTKYGCGIGACGACTVRIDGEAQRSCQVPVAAVDGKRVQTIESLGSDGRLHALQQAWIAHQVPQCGYCQSGLLMAAAALLDKNPRPGDADIDAAITNLCRCGSTVRVRAAIQAAAAQLRSEAVPGLKPAAPALGSNTGANTGANGSASRPAPGVHPVGTHGAP